MAAAGLMTKEGKYYVAKNVPFVTAATLYGGADQIEFKICHTGTWEGVYGANTSDPYEINTEIPVSVENYQNIVINAPEGAYDVYFDNKKGKVWVMTPGNVPDDSWELDGDVVIQHTEGLTLTMIDDTDNNSTAEGLPLSGVTMYNVEVKDKSGNIVAVLDLVTEESAQSIAGEYKVTSYPDEVGEAGNGFDLNLPEWGIVMSGGTILYDSGITYVIDADNSRVKVIENGSQTTILVKGTTTDANGTTRTIAAKLVIGHIW